MASGDDAWGEKVEEAIDTVLRPLLTADGGDIEVLDINLDTRAVHVRLRGKAAFSVGGQYIRTLVIEPLIRKAAGATDVRVVVEESTTRPSSQEIEVSRVMREMAEDDGEPDMAPPRSSTRQAVPPGADVQDEPEDGGRGPSDGSANLGPDAASND